MPLKGYVGLNTSAAPPPINTASIRKELNIRDPGTETALVPPSRLGPVWGGGPKPTAADATLMTAASAAAESARQREDQARAAMEEAHKAQRDAARAVEEAMERARAAKARAEKAAAAAAAEPSQDEASASPPNRGERSSWADEDYDEGAAVNGGDEAAASEGGSAPYATGDANGDAAADSTAAAEHANEKADEVADSSLPLAS